MHLVPMAYFPATVIFNVPKNIAHDITCHQFCAHICSSIWCLCACACVCVNCAYEYVIFWLLAFYLCITGETWKLHRKLMSPSLKDSTVFSHLSIFNFYIREFCNTKLDEESKIGKAFDVMLPLNVVLLSMYLDATLGIEWHQKTAYANFFHE